ncbi:MAG: hypothetical protein AAF196_14605 [Planctomycetota bacterium]
MSSRWAPAVLAGLTLGLAGCSSGGGGDAGGADVGGNNGNAQVVAVRFGRLATILGYEVVNGENVITEFAENVLIGPDIQDERPPGSTLRDVEILYDFLSTDPETLQARVLIPRVLGSDEFDNAFGGLGNRAQEVAPAIFGNDPAVQPFSVIPRNAAIEVEFSESLGIDQDFFVVRDENGVITGQRNTEAIQLLEIRSDPNDEFTAGDFRVIPARFFPDGNRLVIDPVLLGVEGPQLGLRNNASGLPPSSDNLGANIRLAIALEGPLAIDGIFEPDQSDFRGLNNSEIESVIRDFRSGNLDDNGADISRGFVLDPEPPRIIGEIPMFLARVEQPSASTQTITVFKDQVVHELDQGDVVRIVDRDTGVVIGSGEVLNEPADDEGMPDVPFVRINIETIQGLEDIDPQNLPGFPDTDPDAQPLFLRNNAPRLLLLAEFSAVRANRGDPEAPDYIAGDFIQNFVTFSPTPQPLADGTPSAVNENVSPFAEAIIRFNKPVDIATMRAFDSFFFATRNVVDEDLIEAEFLVPRGIDTGRFNYDKFRIPHLVSARVIDEDGSQTTIRLQSLSGFYLDDVMRDADEAALMMDPELAPEDRPFPYFIHVVGGEDGVRDLSGNPIDFNAEIGVVDFQVIPFSLDTRRDDLDRPLFPDNLSVNVVRRFADLDEDPQPSVFRYDAVSNEQPLVDTPLGIEGSPLQDVFGDVTYLANGRLLARITSRFTRTVDDLNQQGTPPQSSFQRFCPTIPDSTASRSAATPFGQGIQNPLNPFGARVQTVWRELDMSLSRVDPADFDLDIEQMYWAPFQDSPVIADQFDMVSLRLSHSEFRPEPCVGSFSSLATLPNSGLSGNFETNIARNNNVNGQIEQLEEQNVAFDNQPLAISAAEAVFEPNEINRFLPLPEFQQPFFTWRDQTVMLQGGAHGIGSDIGTTSGLTPFVPSPWRGGMGRAQFVAAGMTTLTQVAWDSQSNFNFSGGADTRTGGGVGTIALPLLFDFTTMCDQADLPVENPSLATGFNGWQISLSVQSGATPNFRSFSGGFAGNATRPEVCIGPGDLDFRTARGGFNQAGNRVGPPSDNSVYWVMADFVRRQTVATYGFVDIYDPHRRLVGAAGALAEPAMIDQDPRLGPFFFDSMAGEPILPADMAPRFDFVFEPPVSTLPGGTSVVAEFRAATEVPALPWRWDRQRNRLGVGNVEQPTEVNVPLDPAKATDAHIRKFDNRDGRNFWTYYYNDLVSDYTTNINELATEPFLNRFAGNGASFTVDDLRYFNWRFVMSNNVDADPSVSPTIESFAVSYRFESR